jgi:hypothetical protein
LSINPENRDADARSDAPTRELSTPPAPTRELTAVPSAASGDRCGNCGAALAHDQHYCVECGERRGQLTLPKTEAGTEVRASRARAARAPRPPRVSSGTTVVSFVGVLLLAIGLGVLIGRIGNNSNSPRSAGAPATQVISVSGGGGVAGATTPTSTGTTTAPSHISKKTQSKLNAAANAKAPPPSAVQKKAVQAAGKVLGNSNNLAPPTVTNGQKCSSSQAGCSGGSFNGNFFGQ